MVEVKKLFTDVSASLLSWVIIAILGGVVTLLFNIRDGVRTNSSAITQLQIDTRSNTLRLNERTNFIMETNSRLDKIEVKTENVKDNTNRTFELMYRITELEKNNK